MTLPTPGESPNFLGARVVIYGECLCSASCTYPETLAKEVEEWCKPVAEESEESQETRNGLSGPSS